MQMRVRQHWLMRHILVPLGGQANKAAETCALAGVAGGTASVVEVDPISAEPGFEPQVGPARHRWRPAGILPRGDPPAVPEA